MSSYTVLYLSGKNIRDDIFLRDLSASFSWNRPVLIIHDAVLSDDTAVRFQTKRISGHLSEALVANVPVSGDQRGFIQKIESRFQVREDLLRQWFQMAPVVVTNTLINTGERISAGQLLGDLKQQLLISEIVLFPDNPLSPLGVKGESILHIDRIKELDELYPEEENILKLAASLLPVRIRTAKEYSHDSKN